MALSQKSLDFLMENRVMDSRIWFNEHRSDFTEYVQQPLLRLVEDMTPRMLQIDSRFIIEPKKCISRIFRDTRFAANKSIYRENMWITFMREKSALSGLPGYFFSISPTGYVYGCGYYVADRLSMDCMRELILTGDKGWKKALKAFESQSIFGIEGNAYKRSLAPDRSETERQWIDRKDIGLIGYGDDPAVLFSDDLADKLTADFKMLSPVYDFFMQCEALKASKAK